MLSSRAHRRAPGSGRTAGSPRSTAPRPTRGTCARLRAPSDRRGFSVVELLVVLAIAASIMALSVSSFGSLKNAKLRSEAMRMSGALRMVYGRAAVNGLRYQVSFDLEANTYRVDCSSDNVLLPAEDTNASPFDDDDDEADPFGLGYNTPTLEDCSEPLLEQTTLRDGVEIARILTAHHADPVEEGTHTVAYFPNGFVERAIIWLRSGEESYITLSVDPMTGRVIVHPGDFEVPEDFFEVEEDS